jgi:choline kinase
MEAHPNVTFVYNENYDQTNTSKSLLKALRASQESGVLWLNGDVVFDARVLERIAERIRSEKSFVCVNTSATAEEEVKYTVDGKGNINALSKQVKNALGEAVGINFISAHHKSAAIKYLEQCADNDYFERGLELAIENAGIEIEPVDISDLFAVEVDFQADLDRANQNFN